MASKMFEILFLDFWKFSFHFMPGCYSSSQDSLLLNFATYSSIALKKQTSQ